jgi:hypothetical protein
MTTRHDALKTAMEIRKRDGVHYIDEEKPFKLIADGPIGDNLQQFIDEASEVLGACEARIQ